VIRTLPLLLLVAAVAPAADKPNVVFILADDLGYGDLGCYGQTKIKTPNLDKLAAAGVRLTRHYAGNNVCAPSRCVLMTGKHPGHAYIRDNRQAKGFPEGQEPVPEGELVLPRLFHDAGYAVGGFGKWGLGPVGSTGEPHRHGFDRWFGYNCQAVAHNHYPTHLWSDRDKVKLDNPPFAAHQKLPADADPADPASYARYSGNEFAPDRIHAEAVKFLTANKTRPFVLYYATTVPHLALQVPAESLAEYAGKFPEEAYRGDRSYLPHRTPRAAYAAMVTRLDRSVGDLLGKLDEFGLTNNTIVVFTSDNGPLFNRLGGTDADFFDSAAGLKGRKGSFDEGGFRVPGVVRYPGVVPAGGTSARVTGFEDWLPTLAEFTGLTVPAGRDGISFADTLRGKARPPRPFLYRESPGYGGQQCLIQENWKAIRRNLKPGPKAANRTPGKLELYDLATDPGEKADVAAAHPDRVRAAEKILSAEHAVSVQFPMPALDAASKR
jgi:arylsulfatase A